MIDTVVADLGDVAARFAPQRRLDALARATRLSHDEVHRRVWTSGFDDQAELGALERDATITGLCDLLDRRLDATSLITCWAEAFEPNAAILQLLGDVSARTVLFTNNGPMIDACLDGPLARLRRVFDRTICSWHLGARKPTELAFQRAAAQLGGAPRRLLLLDDDPSNVAVARRCGRNAARVGDGDDVGWALERFDVQPVRRRV